MSVVGDYFHFRSILLVLTHDFIIICVYGPTGNDGHERKDADAALRTIFCAVWGEGSAVCLGPRPASQRSPYTNYLRLGWWSTDRHRPMHERHKWTRSVQSRSGILAYLCTRQHWLWITVELHISGERHGEAVAREGGRYAPVRRVSGSEPLGLRTHRRRGRSRPLGCAVVEYQAPSVAVWLQLCPVMHGSQPAHRTPRPCLRTTGQIWHGTLFPQGAMTS